MSELTMTAMSERDARKLTEQIQEAFSEISRSSLELEALRRQLPKEKRSLAGSIYFIQAQQSRAIKIGFAVDVDKRLAQLQAGNAEELTVIATTPGTVKDEKFLHKHFAKSHLRGEWFRETPEIRNYIWRYRR